MNNSSNLPVLITGTKLSCANWQIEAALRMLVNNVVQGAIPKELIIYGGRGKAARNWDAYNAIVESLQNLQPNETLLIQSGKPIGVVVTHEGAPRVLISNSMMVPRWSNDEHFWPLEEKGLTMYGQMTAGSWAFIGQQGIMQGTYETFVAAGAGPGKFLLSSGLGNMSGAQAPAGKMAGAATLIVEIDPSKIERCKNEGWIDEVYSDYHKAIARIKKSVKNKEAIAIALNANIIDVLGQVIQDDFLPDIVTDQTAAHDLLRGYFPDGISFEESMIMRKEDKEDYISLCKKATKKHVSRLIRLQELGVKVFDYGNGLRFHAKDEGLENANDIEGFVPLYVRPLFCEGRGPFRVAALSGDKQDIAVVDKIIIDLFSDNQMLTNWIQKAQDFIDFDKQPGLPARVCWLGMGERAKAVEAIWQAVKNGKTKAPIWVGRDHLDCGSVASPGRETESMKDGSDAIADWPILNALTSVASGSTWTSVHNGGGVGIGKATHTGQCFVITGDDQCLERALRVFTNDPALGVLRHADAGYELAIETAKKHNLKIPMKIK